MTLANPVHRDAVFDAVSSSLRHKIERKTARCGILGLGYIGTEAFRALACAGFTVTGYDRSSRALARFTTEQRELLNASAHRIASEPEALRDADIVVVAVRLTLASDGEVDFEPLRAAAEFLRGFSSPRLIILQSTMPPGTTRRFTEHWLGTTAHWVAHCPERLQVETTHWNMQNIPHVVGGMDETATELASLLYQQFADQVVPVSAPEAAELSKLLENNFMAVGIGLVAEITALAHCFGLSAREVTEAAATKPFGYFPFHPGPGVGGHCIPNDLLLTRHALAEHRVQRSLIEGTCQTLQRMPNIVLDRLRTLLSRELNGLSVLLVGLGFKIGSADTTQSPAFAMAEALLSAGCEVSVTDSRVSQFRINQRVLLRVDSDLSNVPKVDAVLILSGDVQVSLTALSRITSLILDTGGARIMPGEAANMVRL